MCGLHGIHGVVFLAVCVSYIRRSVDETEEAYELIREQPLQINIRGKLYAL